MFSNGRCSVRGLAGWTTVVLSQVGMLHGGASCAARLEALPLKRLRLSGEVSERREMDLDATGSELLYVLLVGDPLPSTPCRGPEGVMLRAPECHWQVRSLVDRVPALHRRLLLTPWAFFSHFQTLARGSFAFKS